MILYFSATGNSAYAARQLAALLDEAEPVSLLPYLRGEQALAVSSDRPYVILSPVYISAIPAIVRQALRAGQFAGSRDVYFVMTCAGDRSAADSFARRLCAEKGLRYMGTAHLSMPQDYLMYFPTRQDAENQKKLAAAEQQLPALAARIRQEQPFDENRVSALHAAVIPPTERLFGKFFIRPEKFYATDDCISCGLCAKVCPLCNIRLEGGKPVWGARCIHCTACINRCPRAAIEYGHRTQGKPRYTAPES